MKILPELRFPDFTNNDQWKADTVQNIVTTKSPPKKLQSSEYLDEGVFPIIDQSQSFYCGYTNDQQAIINEDLPLVIFGDHTCALKMAREPFAQGADGIKILKSKAFIDPEYLYQYLTYNGVKQENYKRHYSKLKEKIVPYPEFESGEQQKIASCLSSLDELIAAHNDKLDALKDHKKGLLQNLFPQEGETVPKVRFSEFEGDGEWVEKKLNTLSKRVIAKNRNGKFTAVFTNSATDGIVDQRDYFDKDIANKKNLENYFVVQNGDYVYNPRISEHAPVGPLFKNRLGKTGVMSPLYTVFRFNEKNNDFYEYYFQTSHWRNSIRAIANTGARFDRISITASLFMEIPVLYTGLMEQQKIASCLSAVDELITAQQEKIEQLQQYKKGLMQGLFPKIES